MTVVAVLGAGVMGSDVAMNCAAMGHSVILKDIDPSIFDAVRSSFSRKLRGYRMMSPSLKNWEAASILERITFTTDYAGFESAEWVIENVPESWNIKRQVYEEVRTHCGPDTYYAVNTSCFPITQIASLMPRPDRVVGAHFMNPVPLKKMVEVVKAHQTSDDTIAAIRAFLGTLGKTAIVVQDFPGFVSNRLSHLFMNEAAFLVQDHVAPPASVDAIFRDGYGHKMGPLETADLIGLDTVVNSLDVLYQSYQDPKFRCCPLLRRMVHAGLLGQKTKKGFYEYGD